MTKTALKALTVAAVSAASILLSGGTALADQPGDCQAGEEYQGEFGCVAVQLPEETQGRQIDCPDGTVGTQHGDMVDCPGASAPQPQPSAQAPAPAAPAPVGTVGPRVQSGGPGGTVPGGTPAAAASPAGDGHAVPGWVVLDKIMQSLKALLPWLF